ncbi:MAG: Gfo/Idh/MocA family oxidoreductase [Tunicatimonas sp.]
MKNYPSSEHPARRTFLKTTGSAVVGSALAFGFAPSRATAFAPNSDTLRVGLVGCGGRGTGAANQALKADDNVLLVAVADVFPDRMQTSLESLTQSHGDKVQVDEDHKFLGFDAYQKLIDSDVDVVILTSPPGFRPDHIQAAVDAKKHVFAEKPVAVDIPGVKKVMEAAKKAKENRTSLMSGLCWRYHEPKRAVFGRVLDGAIGEVTSVYNTYNTGTLWHKDRQPEWTEMEYQMRNWLYYPWLSGDHINEQAIHSLDMASWALGDRNPVSAMGTGGRQVRTDDKYGNVFDHFAITYDYGEGVNSHHFSRQQFNCANSYKVEIQGTKGRALADCIRDQHEVVADEKWRYRGEKNDMYQTEHNELFAAIRADQPVNDGDIMTRSTILAVMGRMAAYTGQVITWEDVMKSTETLGPEKYNWALVYETPPVPMPGITALG